MSDKTRRETARASVRIVVAMSNAGRLHLRRAGASRMLCGVPAENSKAMLARSWEDADAQFKCVRCMAVQTQFERPT